ncbi:MAG TPA: hypothetical protein DHV42_03065 [Lachnospiraceae bacterium]|nr:hypothetical protein [Lachnospiraceae bacterium]
MNDVKMEKGKLNAMGMDINIADVIGSKIVDQWLANVSEEDMALILKAIDEEAFGHTYDDHKYFVKEKKSGKGYFDKTEVTPLWREIQKRFQEKFCDQIMDKMVEVMDSEEYKKRVDKIAQEIMDYAVEGYANDLKSRVKERLVGNVLDAAPHYGGICIQDIINEEIRRQLGR